MDGSKPDIMSIAEIKLSGNECFATEIYSTITGNEGESRGGGEPALLESETITFQEVKLTLDILPSTL